MKTGLQRLIGLTVVAMFALAFTACNENPTAFVGADTADGILEILDAESAQVTAAASTDPDLNITDPVNEEYFDLQIPYTPITVSFGVVNWTFPGSGKRVYWYLDGVKAGESTAVTPFVFPDVPAGQHQLCGVLSQDGEPLPYCTGTQCVTVRVAQPCSTWGDTVCDDGNPCSVEACVHLGGGVFECHFGNTQTEGCCMTYFDCACEGGNWELCGEDSRCAQCTEGDPDHRCDDGEACTIDSCNDGVCVHEHIEDENGKCCNAEMTATEVAAVCNDNVYCTLDYCDTALNRCANVDKGDPNCCEVDPDPACDDGDVCNLDRCISHICRHGPDTSAVNCCNNDAECDDGNACTDDQCDIDNTCINEPNELPNCCNTHPECGNGGTWDDNDPSTLDYCLLHQCVHTPDPSYCDDSGEHPCLADTNACTTDQCVDNRCLHTKIAGCCTAAADCYDNLYCTTDACVNNVCTNTEKVGCCDADWQCADSNTCNLDRCINHICRHGPDSSQPNCCNVDSDCNDGYSCTIEYCNTVTNECIRALDPTHTPKCCWTALDCDDGNPYTLEKCTGYVCSNPPDPTICDAAHPSCDDGNVCTQDSCNLATGKCSHTLTANCCLTDISCTTAGLTDGNPCTTDKCNTTTHQCVFTPITECCLGQTVGECDDANPCTKDSCVSNSCRHVLSFPGCCVTTANCNDNNACTIDSCNVATHTCEYDVATGVDGCCSTPADCYDGDNCTYDLCVKNQCGNDGIPNCCAVDADCDDANICTCNKCVYGTCRYLPPDQAPASCNLPPLCCEEAIDCDSDNNPCTDDLCVANRCVYQAKEYCAQPLPYEQWFNTCVPWADISWQARDFSGGTAANNWKCTSLGNLGPDNHVRFDWTPGALNFDSYLISPALDTTGVNYISVQLERELDWDESRNQPVDLGVYVIRDGAAPLGTVTTDDDIIPIGNSLISYMHDLPQESAIFTVGRTTFSADYVYIALGVAANSSWNLEHYDVDNVKVCVGRPPTFTAVPTQGVAVVGSTVKLPMAVSDPDYNANVQYSIVQGPSFVTLDTTTYDWINLVFKNNLVIRPTTAAHVGDFEVVVEVTDGCLSRRITVPIHVLVNDGYVVWTPKVNGVGAPASHGLAVYNAIVANGKSAQIIEDLSYYPDLTQLDGIFIVTGIYGAKYVLNNTAVTRIVNYLNVGGKVYLEGGDTWAYDTWSNLQPMFKVTPVDDGDQLYPGPLEGRNFLFGRTYNVRNSVVDYQYNSFLDHIDANTLAGAIPLFWNGGSEDFAMSVVYEDKYKNYRTIGSSVPFAAILAAGSGTVNELMGEFLYFFENGFPPCSVDQECWDGIECTNDSCTNGTCLHEDIDNCIPCADDRDCPDTHACRMSNELCLPIPGLRYDSEDTPIVISSSSVNTYTSTINVPESTMVDNVSVKVKLQHAYRGDLRITLSHLGQSVTLREVTPSDSGTDVFYTYDFGSGIFSGSALNMDDFNGESMSGNWTLSVSDLASGAGGSLLEWSLFIVTQVQHCSLDSECNDSNVCTVDSCDDELGYCTFVENLCEDFDEGHPNLCTTDSCDIDLGCINTAADCDDNRPCTVDSCDTLTGDCVNELVQFCSNTCTSHYDCGYDDYCDKTYGICVPIPGVAYRAAADFPLAIPDNTSSELVSTVSISAAGLVREIIVKVMIEHGYPGDLTVTLTRENDVLFLSNQSGGSVDNLFAVYEISEASDDADSLGAFAGQYYSGDWTLTVHDWSTGDSGVLTDWALYVQEVACYVAEDCDDGNMCTIDTCDLGAVGGECLHTPVECDDGSYCNGVEVCMPDSGCQEGTPVVVSDGIPCTADLCVEGDTPQIIHTPTNALCDDGLWCNGAETCAAGIGCYPGTAQPVNDNIDCTLDWCDENVDVVHHEPFNHLCDNGLWCDGVETCDRDSGCVPGMDRVIDDGIYCTVDTCDETYDVIRHSAESSRCDNGLWCDGAEQCDALEGCIEGFPPFVSDGIACTVDVCNETTHSITHTAQDSACDDGIFCNGTERCDTFNGCVNNGYLVVSDGIACTVDSCDEENQALVHLPDSSKCNSGNPCITGVCTAGSGCSFVPNTNSCDNGEPCTVNDHCQDGWCQPGDPNIDNPDCIDCTTNGCPDDGNPCNGTLQCNAYTGFCTVTPNSIVLCTPSDDECMQNACNPASGLCEESPKDAGVVCDDDLQCTLGDECDGSGVCAGAIAKCDDGLFCNGTETCDGLTGECAAGEPPLIDDGILCTMDSCDEENDVVLHVPNNTACNDSQFCNGLEVCDPESGCQPGEVPGLDDGISCTQDICNETSDFVEHVPDDDFCNDGLFCNGWEVCSPTEDCYVIEVPVVDDGVECTEDVCDEELDDIVHTPIHSECDNGDQCDGVEFCHLVLGCQDGTPPDTDDGIECTIDSCANGVMNHVADNTLCDDGKYCNGAETCNALAGCVSGTPPETDDGVECTIDYCDEPTDSIVNLTDDNRCNDGLFCNGVEFCDPVQGCLNGTAPACSDGNPCTQDTCNTSLNGGIGACDNSQRVQYCISTCGGTHAFDAGDNACGYDDACVGGLGGPTAGNCSPVCDLSGNCVKGDSGLINTPINDNSCIYKTVTINPQYAYVAGLNVKVEVLHSHIGDLLVELGSPSGPGVTLWAQGTGQERDNFYNTFTLSYPNIPGDFCSLTGLPAAGTWTLRVCDQSEGNTGKLVRWKLYVESTNADLSDGDTCEDPIVVSSANGTAQHPGTTACANDYYSSSCGGGTSTERVYRFTTTVPKRVSVDLVSNYDAVLYLKAADGATCSSDTFACADACVGSECTETLSRRLTTPGTYYLFVDGAGGEQGIYNMSVTFFELLDNGDACSENGECFSNHCANGYCCDDGTCCAIPSNCPASYFAPSVCDTISTCQGHRVEATCQNSQCGSVNIDDDSGCEDEIAKDCGCYFPVVCTGATSQTAPACANICTIDTQCSDSCHCDYPLGCLPDLDDGETCDENSDCISGHCNNHICCAAGDCCTAASQCDVAEYTAAPSCVSPASCQGQKGVRICQNFQCGMEMQDDDTPCYAGMVASECDCFPSVTCTGGAVQTAPSCQTSCVLDPECDETCHCDDTCLLDVENGGACDELSDCVSNYCANGYCCESGVCCGVPENCPEDYSADPECDDSATCQGHRDAATCLNSECGTNQVNDDSACGLDTLADECGLYKSQYCTGQVEQPIPACPETCVEDTDCDDIAHCDVTCVLDLPNGSTCDENSDCISEHCQNGFCCDSGDCCAAPDDCPAEYHTDSVCDDPANCQGFRLDKRCENYICDNTPIPDDSGCDAETVSDECDCYVPIFCNGLEEQAAPACPTSCTVGTECDANCHCEDIGCVPNLPNGEGCDEDSDCYSLHCVDGVCCDTSCNSPCEACNIAGYLGTCTPYASNTDPFNECGLCGVCNGHSACSLVPNGQDPVGDCAQQDAATCLKDGYCNGNGACRLWLPTTICVARACEAGILAPQDYCNGTGLCIDAGLQSCSPYGCNAAGNECLTSCTKSADCFDGFWCNSSGKCVAKKATSLVCNPTLAKDQVENPNVQCQSNFCVDGYCCNSACDAGCQACDMATKEGQCTYYPPNSDPEDDCETCQVCNGSGACVVVPFGEDYVADCDPTNQSTCSLDGYCDGEGTCRLWLPGTICVEQSCVASADTLTDYQINADLCDGDGLCVDMETTNCYPYVCDGTWGCFTACYNNEQCADDSFCNGTHCVLKKDNGETCSGDEFDWECKSNFCVDGFCCDDGCLGECRSCAIGGFEGSCTAYGEGTDPENDCIHCYMCNGADNFATSACVLVPSGSDPLNECGSTGPETCGLDGTCDGAGLCRKHVPGTVCVPQWCESAERHEAFTCDGSGTCDEGPIVPCSPYICNELGEDCRTHCEQNDHCVDGFWCDDNQDCVPEREDGAVCTIGYQCASSHCVDGFCCDTACDTICHSCALVPGVCTNHTPGTDPEDDCTLCMACNGDGSLCVNVQFGLDPELDCSDDAAFTCDYTGVCNGDATCQIWPEETECSVQYCLFGIKYPPDECNGIFECIDSGTVNCEPYACDDADFECRTSCDEQFHCLSEYYCDVFSDLAEDHLCKAKLDNGDGCLHDEQCTSSFCIDGVCCESSCDGECKACNVAGQEGSCILFANDTDPETECGLCRVCNGGGACKDATNGTDPKSECAMSDQTTCDFDGECDGAGACRFWNTETMCVDKSCVGFTFYPIDFCSGDGDCIDTPEVDCSPYNCNAAGNACRTVCAVHEDCVDGYWCNVVNQCVAKKSNGDVCGSGSECHSGFCVDGVCCDVACDGTCRACTLEWQAPATVVADGNMSEWDVPAHVLGIGPNNVGYRLTWNDTYLYLGLTGVVVSAGGYVIFIDKDVNPSTFGATASPGTDSFAGAYRPDYFISVTSAGVQLYTHDGTSWSAPVTKNVWQRYVGVASNKNTELRVPLAEIAGVSPDVGFRMWQAIYRSADGSVISTWPAQTEALGTVPIAFDKSQFVKGAAGMCKVHPFYTDPEFECGTCKVCDGMGACMSADDGDDPKENCTKADESTCELDGQCDGVGACRYWNASTVCVEQTCVDHTRFPADFCDGDGLCVDTASQACDPYMCDAAGEDCRTGCAEDAHCITTHYCLGDECVHKKANGDSCVEGRECTSSFCADGVCCDTACDSKCEACAKTGHVGTCTLHSSNTDPDDDCTTCMVCTGTSTSCTNVILGIDPVNDCEEQGQSTCQLNGICDGAGACQLWIPGTVCQDQYCAAATLHYEDTCDGVGTCDDNGTLSCAPYQCNDAGFECRTDCGTDDHCVSGFFCNAGSACEEKYVVGSECGANNQCKSNFCVDGFCCDQACSGNCQACDYPGQEGTCKYWDNDTDPDVECGLCGVCNGAGDCRPAASGTDPKTECTQSTEVSCGLDGQCDGAYACRFWNTFTVCDEQECIEHTKYPTDYCSGDGTCVIAATVNCEPYVCNAGQTECLFSCGTDDDCMLAYWCEGSTCVPEKADGQACGGDNECINKHCTDGVCCNTACGGTCESCAQDGHVGVCTPYVDDTDPETECGLCNVCNGASACRLVLEGLDPLSHCAITGADTCGQDGTCDGSGACRLWLPGTVCVDQSCVGQTMYPADTCDGVGACVDNGQVDCLPYVCSGDDINCLDACVDDGDCQSTHWCEGDVCVEKKVNGDTCVGGNECISSFCADGFCCNEACDRTCESCAVNAGTCVIHAALTDPDAECALCTVCSGVNSCVPAADGTDPVEDCAQDPESTCDEDGVCDGAGACRLWASGTECVAQFCSAGFEHAADQCDGLGACADFGTTACTPYVCDADGFACLHICASNADCVGTHWCQGNACVSKKPLAALCDEDYECSSNHCVDGVCCNLACDGLCEACDISGVEGTCTFFSVDTDPEIECPSCQLCNGGGACKNVVDGYDPKGNCTASAVGTCQFDGFCDGTGDCRLWNDETICVQQTCLGSTKHLAQFCDGLGTCEDPQTVSCCPFMCWNNECRSSCSLDTQCCATAYCDGIACQNKKIDGDVCGRGEECQSGNCVDGYCCNEPCDGECRSCALPTYEGTCRNYTANTDPEIECGKCRVCNGAGSCRFETEAQDVKNECSQSLEASCGQDGYCNGAGNCGKWDTSTVCVSQTCEGTTLYPADYCSGTGSCVNTASSDCYPYACNGDGTACNTGCGSDAQCHPTAWCFSGNCVAKYAQGDECTASNQCLSNKCVDGYCCNTSCNAGCEACNVAGSEGTCTLHLVNTDPEDDCPVCEVCTGINNNCAVVAAGSDPANDCDGTSVATCGLDGECNGASACRLWVPGSICLAQYCVAGTRYLAKECNGTGSCLAQGTESCLGYACLADGTDCRTSCTADDQCLSDYWCNTVSSTCEPKKAVGVACGAGNQCLSSFCVDGVCCNTSCTGECKACDVASHVGSCWNVPNDTDPALECGTCQVCSGGGYCKPSTQGTDLKNQCALMPESGCGFDGFCDGNAACELWPLGTICVAQYCASATLHLADECDGMGSCTDSGTQACSPYVCLDGTNCGTSCSVDANCVTGNYCSGSSCVPKKANGQTCSAANECLSSQCVDGYCCNSACTGDCRACNVAGHLGTCSYYADGTDPESQCGLCKVCNATGACRNAGEGTDPKAQCAAEAESTCGQDGFCNGLGACRKWPGGTFCGDQTCSDTDLTSVRYCDGDGGCLDAASGCEALGWGQGAGSPWVCGESPEPCLSGKTFAQARAACEGIGARLCTWDEVLDSEVAGTGCGFDNQRIWTLSECAEGSHYTGAGDPNYLASAPQACTADTLLAAVRCCADYDSCCPYRCVGDGCGSTCASQADCCDGYYCSNGECLAQAEYGDTCTADIQCLSDHCVDGYCCDTSCTGGCEACNLTGHEGTCTPRPDNTDVEGACPTCQVCDGNRACRNASNGTDPGNDCEAAAASTCDFDGYCNGSGACRLWVAPTACTSVVCSDYTLHPVDTCNGLGDCIDSGTSSCCPFKCNAGATACRTTCTADTQCCSDAYCTGGVCQNKKANGQVCTASNQCSSGNCIDGVCCNTACNGTCQACNVTGSVGTCVNFANNTDPSNECALCKVCNGAAACVNVAAGLDPLSVCAETLQSTCGLDGACDGNAACERWSSSTVCVAESCTGNTHYKTDLCNGTGSCIDAGTESCCPYNCGATSCLNSCSTHTQCCSDSYCSGSTCVAKKAIGATCGENAECAGGMCVDGYCCNTACAGTCQACNVATKEGTCTNFTNQTDPEDECGSCRVCNGTGSCVNVLSGSDPLNDCTAADPASCGLNGTCNGSGTCAYWSVSTVCVEQSCADFMRQPVGYCNGSGTCNQPAQVNCCPYKCTGSSCRTACGVDTDCCDGNYCLSTTCTPKKANGATCSAANQCSSGYCVDGYCCENSCTGTCRACNVASFEGTCKLFAVNTDPGNECTECKACNGSGSCVNVAVGTDPVGDCTQAAPCGLDGQCNGSGACRLWVSGTTCNPQTCSGSTLYLIDTCNGTGTCSDAGTTPCDPYLCNAAGSACRTNCGSDSDCTNNNYCSLSACKPKKANGDTCGATNECLSGYCVDGVCCGSACTGTCAYCAAGTGVCTYVANNTDSTNECGLCRVCNGGGACRDATPATDPKNQCTATAANTCGLDGNCSGGACSYWNDTTVCGSESCNATTEVYTYPPECNGSGACTASGTASCCPYQCGATACKTSCAVASETTDCCSTAYCNGSSCTAKLGNGNVCTRDTQCTSGFCADGYCCDSTCTGDCRSCNQTGHLGQCTYYASGLDPENNCSTCKMCNGSGTCVNQASTQDLFSDCADQGAAGCDYNGLCNGSGACALYPYGTVCVAQTCSGSTQYYADQCDGSGTCVDKSTKNCCPYVCSGNSCATTCSGDSTCCSGNYCSGSTCYAKKANGVSCTAANQCASNYCVDGVCCNNSCAGDCRSCSTGTCTNYAVNTDPENNCSLCKTCNGSGACTNVTAGYDYQGDCTQSATSTCGLDGECNGSAACRYWSPSTVCVDQSCTGNQLSSARYCNGSGTCLAGSTSTCPNAYVCSGNACRTSCSADAHCISSYMCTNPSTCTDCAESCTNNVWCCGGDSCSGVVEITRPEPGGCGGDATNTYKTSTIGSTDQFYGAANDNANGGAANDRVFHFTTKSTPDGLGRFVTIKVWGTYEPVAYLRYGACGNSGTLSATLANTCGLANSGKCIEYFPLPYNRDWYLYIDGKDTQKGDANVQITFYNPSNNCDCDSALGENTSNDLAACGLISDSCRNFMTFNMDSAAPYSPANSSSYRRSVAFGTSGVGFLNLASYTGTGNNGAPGDFAAFASKNSWSDFTGQDYPYPSYGTVDAGLTGSTYNSYQYHSNRDMVVQIVMQRTSYIKVRAWKTATWNPNEPMVFVMRVNGPCPGDSYYTYGVGDAAEWGTDTGPGYWGATQVGYVFVDGYYHSSSFSSAPFGLYIVAFDGGAGSDNCSTHPNVSINQGCL